MTFNDAAKPSGWVYPSTPQRGNMFVAADLVSGAVPVRLDRYDGPIVDTFTAADGAPVAGRTAEIGAGSGWQTYASGTGSWAIASGAATWTPIGAGAGIAFVDTKLTGINSGNRTFNVTFTITSGTAYVLVHDKSAAAARTIICTVGSVLTMSGSSGSTTLTAGTHTIRVVVTNTVAVTSFDAAVYLDTVLQFSGTYTAGGDGSTNASYGFAADSTAAGLSFTRFEVEELAAMAATSWVCRNASGTTVASGSLTSSDTAVSVPVSGLYQFSGGGNSGWYHLLLYGADRADGAGGWRTAYGDIYFSLFNARTAGFPTKPSKAATRSGDNEWDEPTHGYLGLGPVRYSGLTSATSVAAIDGIGQVADTWYRSLGTAARPRHTVALFPDGTYPNASNVTALVTAAKTYVDCWEAFNEPGLPDSTSASTYVTQQLAPFYAAVKAGDAGAVVIGPSIVTNGDIVAYQRFVDAGGLAYVDAIGYHAYNQSRIDLGRCRRVLADFQAFLTANSITKPVYQTEQGSISEYNGIFQPLEAAQDNSVQVFMQELYGIPMERNVVWYDSAHGFDSYPAWQLGHYDNAPLPAAVAVRNMASELYDAPLFSRFDFGDGADLYAGGWFKRAADGTSVVGLIAQSDTLPAVQFAITGTTSPLTYVDPWGNTTTLTVTGGKVAVPVFDRLVGWLRLPSGVTAALTPSDWTWGVDNSRAASGASIATSGGTFVNASRVIDTEHHSIGNGNYTPPAVNASSTFPQTWTIDMGASKTIDHLPVRVIGPTAFTVDTSPDGSAWTNRITYAWTKQMDRYSGNHRNYWQRYDRPREAHMWAGTAVAARYVRLTVTNAMWSEVYIPSFDLQAQADEAYSADTSTWPMAFHVQVPWMRAYTGTAAIKPSILLIRA